MPRNGHLPVEVREMPATTTNLPTVARKAVNIPIGGFKKVYDGEVVVRKQTSS